MVLAYKALNPISFGFLLVLFSFCYINQAHSQSQETNECKKIPQKIELEIGSAKTSHYFSSGLDIILKKGWRGVKKVPQHTALVLQDLKIIYGNKNNQKFLLKNLGYGLGFQFLSQALTSFGVLPWSTLSLDYLHNIVMTGISTSLFLKSQFKPIMADLRKISKNNPASLNLEEHLLNNKYNLDLINDDYNALFAKIKGEVVNDPNKSPQNFKEKFLSLKEKYKKDFFYSLIIVSMINVTLDSLLTWKMLQDNPELQNDPTYLKTKLKFQISFVAVNTLKNFLLTTPLYLLVNNNLIDSLIRTINHIGTSFFYQCARLKYIWMPLKTDPTKEDTYTDEFLSQMITRLKQKRDQVIKYCQSEEGDLMTPKKPAQNNQNLIEEITEIDQKIEDLKELKKIVIFELYQHTQN